MCVCVCVLRAYVYASVKGERTCVSHHDDDGVCWNHAPIEYPERGGELSQYPNTLRADKILSLDQYLPSGGESFLLLTLLLFFISHC